ncbi:NAD-dependent succinate-semialdehyde dehydrogenase [Aliibacillus thermotolerans]|uniref:Aldehyde dehydrogenase n=1 Tax=Aliibacillus thermotolerans TaxID=1834418 RepID=A0ABW0U859_9BACI|nr:NAD-dependent succinate-semialdehyde dehydrogenase [Aliibacillus thermotolerans]MDA3129624.1 succinate-semialdehyde dehydrogenase [Aliibacillus thermotolerans]
MYINGKWVGNELEKTEVVNPSTQQIVGTVPEGGRKEATLAVDAAHEAFKTWSKKTADERSSLLYRWYELIDENKEEMATLMTKEQGKPYQEAYGEVNYANGFIKWYAEEAKRIYGDTIPASQSDKRIIVQKQPVGVAAVITPWNFPAAMITRKVGPALAAGCTVVIKPAEQTPLTAIMLAELAEEAGIPAGVVNVVTGEASDIGKAWLDDKRVRKLTFTGSTPVGKLLMEGSARTLKKVSLELGGQAPLIVMDDADIDQAVEGAVQSKYRNAGQTCVCSNRMYVHESIAEPFAEKMAKAVENLTVGDGLEEGVTIGPLIDEDAIEKVEKHVEDAKAKGAKIVSGGVRHEKGDLFYTPTVIMNATEDMLCMTEETFGPVAPIATFKTDEEAIERANDTDFGLAAYVFTKDLSRAFRISEALEYGIVGVNDGVPSTPQAPFGGMKESGIGREGGYYGIEEFLEIKYTSFKI